MSGWIKLHRELFDKPIWQLSAPAQRVILVTLLLMANHQEKEWEFKGQKYVVKPGQFITSLASIAEKSGKGISIKNVRTALDTLEKREFLTSEATNRNRLITIVNWELYQGLDVEGGKATGKQQASNRQATGKQLATNKNDKELKNEKNDKEVVKSSTSKNAFSEYQSTFGLPNSKVIEELKSWIEIFGNEIVCKAIDLSSHANWPYARKVLSSWEDRGFKTIADVEKAEAEFNANKAKKGFAKQTKQEVIPSWFDNQQSKPVESKHVELPAGLRKLMDEGRKEDA